MFGEDCLVKGAKARTSAISTSVVQCYVMNKWDLKKVVSAETVAALLQDPSAGDFEERQLLDAFYQCDTACTLHSCDHGHAARRSAAPWHALLPTSHLPGTCRPEQK